MLYIKPPSLLQVFLQSHGNVCSRPIFTLVMAEVEPCASSKSVTCDVSNNICFIILSIDPVLINVIYCCNWVLVHKNVSVSQCTAGQSIVNTRSKPCIGPGFRSGLVPNFLSHTLSSAGHGSNETTEEKEKKTNNECRTLNCPFHPPFYWVP